MTARQRKIILLQRRHKLIGFNPVRSQPLLIHQNQNFLILKPPHTGFRHAINALNWIENMGLDPLLLIDNILRNGQPRPDHLGIGFLIPRIHLDLIAHFLGQIELGVLKSVCHPNIRLSHIRTAVKFQLNPGPRIAGKCVNIAEFSHRTHMLFHWQRNGVKTLLNRRILLCHIHPKSIPVIARRPCLNGNAPISHHPNHHQPHQTHRHRNRPRHRNPGQKRCSLLIFLNHLYPPNGIPNLTPHLYRHTPEPSGFLFGKKKSAKRILEVTNIYNVLYINSQTSPTASLSAHRHPYKPSYQTHKNTPQTQKK